MRHHTDINMAVKQTDTENPSERHTEKNNQGHRLTSRPEKTHIANLAHRHTDEHNDTDAER